MRLIIPQVHTHARTTMAATTKKVINFGAGPAKLPEEVLAEVQRDFLNYGDTGMSITELSHRSSTYLKLNQDAQEVLRDLLNIPDNYQVLFMQGGGTGIFAAVCLNLLPEGQDATADYVVTGVWSKKAADEAKKYCKVNYVLPEDNKSYTTIPEQSSWKLSTNAAFVFYCANETVHGIEFPFIPETNGIPLVCDMSSNFLSRPVDVSKFAVIFAGAQKNIGPSGATVVIVRDDLLGKAWRTCPSVLDFKVMAAAQSVYNTPPTFNVYIMGRVFEWIRKAGGLEEMERRSSAKSGMVYDQIKQSNGFYACTVEARVQSRMNVPFRIGSKEGVEALEKEFLSEAEKMGLFQLKGHRMVGGIRASLYNALTIEETQTLVNFMKDFYEKHK